MTSPSEDYPAPFESVLDPLRLAPAACHHGVWTHPLFPKQWIKGGQTWIRAKYVIDLMGRCIRCKAEREGVRFVSPPDFPLDRSLLPPGWIDTKPDGTPGTVLEPMPHEVSQATPYEEP